MTFVYVLFSKKREHYYVGSCLNLEERLQQHKDKIFPNSFTASKNDWDLFLVIEELEFNQARNIENHIKKMKSRIYISNLRKFPEMIVKLKLQYLP